MDEFVAATRAREEQTRARSGQPLLLPPPAEGKASPVDTGASHAPEARGREPPAGFSGGDELPSSDERAEHLAGDVRRVRWQPASPAADRVTLAGSRGDFHPQAEPDELPTVDQILNRLVDIQVPVHNSDFIC